MAKPRPTTPVATVLTGLLKHLKAEAKPTLEEMQGAWKRLAGEGAAQHSWPKTLRGRRLTVEVENSGWMYTLGLKKNQLLQGLIELMGAGKVKQLSFRMGERK